MKWVLVAGAVVAALVVLVAIVGAFRPETHTASYTATIAAAPDTLWAAIADFERQAEWVPEVTGVERLPDRYGHPSYREHFGRFEATTVITQSDPPRLLVKEILPGGPFHGSWTWELAPEGEGTRLTITERGTVPNPLFRGMMVFHDETKSAREYAAALARRIGANLEVVP